MSPENIASDPASVVCRSEAKFEQWAKPLHLDQELYEDLPDELQGILEASYKFPAWVGDSNADQIRPYRKIFSSEIEALKRRLANRTTDAVGEQTDAETAEQLSLALPHILNIPKTYEYVSESVKRYCGEMNEADMRTPLDQLLNHVWHNEAVPNFAHILERKLQLPKPNSGGATPVTETISDSIVLFLPPEKKFQVFFNNRADDRPAWSCLAREHTPAILHWATEYEQDDPLTVSRQTRMAMVSGLYQRRALGFMDHFVFGTAHSGNRLDVFAGRWELVKSPADQMTGPSPAEKDVREGQATSEQTDKDITPPADQKSTLRSSKKPPSGSASNWPKKGKYEIKIYQFPGYLLLSPLDMIKFYMLMRASRDLATKYASDIFSDQYGTVLNLTMEDCTWPADPRDSQQRRTSGSNSRANSQHQSGLGAIEEQERDRADFSPDHHDNGVDEWEVDDEWSCHLDNQDGPGWYYQLSRQPTPPPDQKVQHWRHTWE